MSPEQIRDFWFKYSTSTNKIFVLNQWSNIKKALKHPKISFEGKRKFVAVAMGQISTLLKWRKVEGTNCPRCDAVMSTIHATDAP